MFDFSAEGMRQRALLAGGIIAYILFFERLYVSWLYPEFGYFGFDYNAPETGYLGLAWTLSLLPTLWMPRAIARPSQLAYWVLYLTVLIPLDVRSLVCGSGPTARDRRADAGCCSRASPSPGAVIFSL
jgi:hypothetical protein